MSYFYEEVERITRAIEREYAQRLAAETDQLPFIGGMHDHSYRNVPRDTVAMTAAYVEPQDLPFALSMSPEDVTALMTGEPVEGVVQRTHYLRGRFLIMDDAWVDVVLARDHEPSPDDKRWVLANVAECVVVALSGGYSTPISTGQRIMGRLRSSLELGRWSAPAADGRMSITEWNANRPFIAEFDRQRVDSSATSWRQFFEALTIDSDTWSMEGSADICWRCDARHADDNLGLCAHCREDMNPADE